MVAASRVAHRLGFAMGPYRMTPREYLLARVLSEPSTQGPALVLKGPGNQTAERLLRADQVAFTVDLAEGENTWEEARNAVRFYHRHLTLVTSAYHQLRAFLTFVKAFEGERVRIWNAPAPSSMDTFAKEIAKIEEYQVLGHVATYEDGVAYLEWRDGLRAAA